MAPTASDLKTRFPEFDSVADATVNLFISDAALSINTSVFGNKSDLANIYLAAHLLSLSDVSGGGGGAAGQITEEKVGDLTRKYGSGSVSVNNDGINSTKYGQAYLRLRKESVLKPILVKPTGFTALS